MKCKNFKVFKQLLNKGVSPLCMNSDGMTAIHYAIELERFEYLAYLFEGDSRTDYNDYSLIMDDSVQSLSPERIRSTQANYNSQPVRSPGGKQPTLFTSTHSGLYGVEEFMQKVSGIKFVWESMHSLDQKSFMHGFTPFHLAVIKGNQVILRYLVRMYR
jgi:ankyrin repeat protein